MVPMPSTLPPGPRFTPWDLIIAILDPGKSITKMIKEYGDPYTSKLLNQTTVMSAHPDGVRQLITANANYFEVPNPDTLAFFLGDNSLLLLVGERHRTERKLLNPHFHGDRMRAYGSLMREITLEHARLWPKDAPFRMADTTQAISMEVIIRAVFGVASERVEEFRQVILSYVHAISPLLVFFSWMRRPLWGLGPWDRFVASKSRLDRMIDEEAERRRASQQSGPDILSILTAAQYDDGSKLSNQQIRDQLLTLLFAGHEATGVALAWVIYYLHRHPEMLERVRAEVTALGPDPDPDELARLPYLSAVCNETLRLHPIVPVLPPRQVREPFDFMGFTLPPGTLVSIGTCVLHRREEIYPNPDEFRPERFLGHTFSPFEYMPLGGGSRRCLGAAFALYEMKIVLATLLYTYRLALVSDKPVREVRRNTNMGPSGGIPMRLLSSRSQR